MEKRFVEHMTKKYSNLNVEKIIELVDRNILEIQTHRENPNKEIALPLNCDMNKNMIIKIISEYIEFKK